MVSKRPPAWTGDWSAELLDGEWIVPFQNLDWAYRGMAMMVRFNPGVRLEVVGTNRRAFVKEGK